MFSDVMKGENWWVGRTTREIERLVIYDCLYRHRWNRTKARIELGICIRTLREKIAAMRAEGILIPDREIAAGFRTRMKQLREMRAKCEHILQHTCQKHLWVYKVGESCPMCR